MMKHHLTRLDVTISQKFAVAPESRRWHWAKRLAHVGDGPNVFSALVGIYLLGWLFDSPELCRVDLIVAGLVLAAMAVVTLIKFAVRRQRPQPPGEFVTFQYDAYSFPSGHSGRMAALAVSTQFFYPLLGWLLLIIALVVAAARVMVGVHYLSDIVAGLLVGSLVAIVGVALLVMI